MTTAGTLLTPPSALPSEPSYIVIDGISFHPSTVPELREEIKEIRRAHSSTSREEHVVKTPVVAALEELLREEKEKGTRASKASSSLLEEVLREKRCQARHLELTPELHTTLGRIAAAEAMRGAEPNFLSSVATQIRKTVVEGLEGLRSFLAKPMQEQQCVAKQVVDEHLKEMLTPRTFSKAATVLVGMEVGESICGFIFGALGGEAVGQVVGSVVGSVLFEYLAVVLDVPAGEDHEPSLKEYWNGLKKLGDIGNTMKRLHDFPRWGREFLQNLQPEETSSWLLHLAGHKFLADVPGIMAGWAVGTALGLPPGATAALSCLGNWMSSFLFHWMVEGHEAWALRRKNA